MDTPVGTAHHASLYPVGYLVALLLLVWCVVAFLRQRFPISIPLRKIEVTRERRPKLFWLTLGGYLVLALGLLLYPLIG